MLGSVVTDIETGAHTIPSFGYTQSHVAAPDQASILVGEVIQALRRALDYLVFELAFRDSGVEQDDTQFPFDDGRQWFWGRLKRKRPNDRSCFLIGIDPKHAAVIEDFQPFTGADWAKTLRKISNPDKHRRLVFVRGAPSMRITPKPVAKRDRFKRRTDVRRTRDGFIALWRLSTSVHVKFHITAHVAFSDKTRVIDTLEEIKLQVARALDAFRPCFDGRCPH